MGAILGANFFIYLHQLSSFNNLEDDFESSSGTIFGQRRACPPIMPTSRHRDSLRCFWAADRGAVFGEMRERVGGNRARVFRSELSSMEIRLSLWESSAGLCSTA